MSLIEDTYEFVDIFSQVFQFMEIKDIYPLQRVSGFFFRMIEKLKETYIRPVYEIGVVATNEEQLEHFVRNYLNSSQPPKKYPTMDEFTASDNFTDEIASISEVFTVYEKYERQFIFKQDRFRAIFYPIICGKHGSLGRDELNRLEGFIFLSPEYSNGYAFMPEGVDICATVLDDHLYSGKHFVKEEEKEKFKDRGLGFVKNPNSTPQNNNTIPLPFIELKKIRMPIFQFGIVLVDDKVYKYQEESLVQCLMYIVSHSKRCLDLDHSLSNNKQNNEELKGSQKLFEKITKLIKLKDDELIRSLKSLFKNRFDYYNLLATDNLVYMMKRLCFFHIPLGIQVVLLRKLYTALVRNNSSLAVNNGKVTVQVLSEYLSVEYKQVIANGEADYTYNYYGNEKKVKKDIRLVTIRFYYGEKIEFDYKRIGKHNNASNQENKCCLQ